MIVIKLSATRRRSASLAVPLITVLVSLLFVHCQRPRTSQETEPAVSGPAPNHRLQFVDVAAEAGLDTFLQENGNKDKPYIVETVGGGVAWLDYDQDGDLDLYLTNGSSDVSGLRVVNLDDSKVQ
jgi:hypothetical protein